LRRKHLFVLILRKVLVCFLLLNLRNITPHYWTNPICCMKSDINKNITNLCLVFGSFAVGFIKFINSQKESMHIKGELTFSKSRRIQISTACEPELIWIKIETTLKRKLILKSHGSWLSLTLQWTYSRLRISWPFISSTPSANAVHEFATDGIEKTTFCVHFHYLYVIFATKLANTIAERSIMVALNK